MFRRVEVDQQLDEFESSLVLYLSHAFVFHVNYDYWEEMDEHDVESLRSVEEGIDEGFDSIMNMYKYNSEVYSILDDLRVMLHNAVWLGMNVPFPRDPYRHLDCIVRNVQTIYIDTTIGPLRNAIINTNHRVEVIQRSWRVCIADPHYKACINRLTREAVELKYL
jgi:hypothetical protein